MTDHDSTAQPKVEVSALISDLDDLVRALVQGTPPVRPWQRQLLARLAQVDRGILVLRMTIALGRNATEISAASAQLQTMLTLADAASATDRSDLTTKAAVRFALGLGKRVRDLLNG